MIFPRRDARVSAGVIKRIILLPKGEVAEAAAGFRERTYDNGTLGLHPEPGPETNCR
jgi:hypothetical protein